MPDRILLIDPDPDGRDSQLIALSEAGFEAIGAAGAELAFELIESMPPDVIICDALEPGTDDLELVWQLSRRAPGSHAARHLLAQTITRQPWRSHFAAPMTISKGPSNHRSFA